MLSPLSLSLSFCVWQRARDVLCFSVSFWVLSVKTWKHAPNTRTHSHGRLHSRAHIHTTWNTYPVHVPFFVFVSAFVFPCVQFPPPGAVQRSLFCACVCVCVFTCCCCTLYMVTCVVFSFSFLPFSPFGCWCSPFCMCPWCGQTVSWNL